MPSPRVHRPPPTAAARPGGRRAPWLASVVLHAVGFLLLARFGGAKVAPAEVRFEVSVTSVACEEAAPPDDADLPTTEPAEARWETAAAPPPLDLPDADALDAATPPADDAPEPLDASDVVEPSGPTDVGPVGPSSPTLAVRRPAPVPPPAPPAPPAPPTPPPPAFRPSTTTAVAAPAAAPSAASSAVEGARPDAGNAPPVYPADARAERRSGVVTLRIEVDEAGAVRAVAVAASSGHPSLDAAALEAARGWRFTPARRGGVPFASAVLRRVRFVLEA